MDKRREGTLKMQSSTAKNCTAAWTSTAKAGCSGKCVQRTVPLRSEVWTNGTTTLACVRSKCTLTPSSKKLSTVPRSPALCPRHARMVTLSGQIVQSVMEDLRLRNYNDLKSYAAQSQPVSFSSTLASERFSSSFTTGFALSGNFTTLVASAPATGQDFRHSDRDLDGAGLEFLPQPGGLLLGKGVE